jgi:hypothetical protein
MPPPGDGRRVIRLASPVVKAICSVTLVMIRSTCVIRLVSRASVHQLTLASAGGKLCCTWRGCSVCVEVGFGVGVKLQAGSGGRDRSGSKIGGELSGKCGPAGAGIGVGLDDRGCLEVEAQGELGFINIEGDKVNVQTDPTEDRNAPSTGCGAQ